jgi:hypothetical protein
MMLIFINVNHKRNRLNDILVINKLGVIVNFGKETWRYIRAFLGSDVAIPILNEELIDARSDVYKTYTSDEATTPNLHLI